MEEQVSIVVDLPESMFQGMNCLIDADKDLDVNELAERAIAMYLIYRDGGDIELCQ